MGQQALNSIPIVGPLVGGLLGGAQQSQANKQGNANLGAASGELNSLLSGPIASMLNGTSNVFPSAGTSAMETLLSRVGTVANPGAAISDTSNQIAETGMAGQLATKQAGLADATGIASGLQGIGNDYLGLASGMGSPWGTAVSGATSGLTSKLGTGSGKGGGGGGSNLGALAGLDASGAATF
jgi:hypothetical protein